MRKGLAWRRTKIYLLGFNDATHGANEMDAADSVQYVSSPMNESGAATSLVGEMGHPICKRGPCDSVLDG